MAPQGHPSACCHGGKRRWRPLVSMWCVAMFKFLKIACCCSMCDCHARIIRWQPVRWLPTVLGCGLGPEAWPRPSPPCRLTACCDGQGGANKHRQKRENLQKLSCHRYVVDFCSMYNTTATASSSRRGGGHQPDVVISVEATAKFGNGRDPDT